MTSPSERCRLGFRAQRAPPGPPGQELQELQELQLFGPARQELSDQGLRRRRGRNARNYKSPLARFLGSPPRAGTVTRITRITSCWARPARNFGTRIRAPPGPPLQELQELQLCGHARPEFSEHGLGRRRRRAPLQELQGPQLFGPAWSNSPGSGISAPPRDGTITKVTRITCLWAHLAKLSRNKD